MPWARRSLVRDWKTLQKEGREGPAARGWPLAQGGQEDSTRDARAFQNWLGIPSGPGDVLCILGTSEETSLRENGPVTGEGPGRGR